MPTDRKEKQDTALPTAAFQVLFTTRHQMISRTISQETRTKSSWNCGWRWSWGWGYVKMPRPGDPVGAEETCQLPLQLMVTLQVSAHNPSTPRLTTCSVWPFLPPLILRLSQGRGCWLGTQLSRFTPHRYSPNFHHIISITPLIIPRREEEGAMSPSAFSILGIWPPANHPLLLDSHQSDPARSHLHWEVFPGFPWHTLLLSLLGKHCLPHPSLHSFAD